MDQLLSLAALIVCAVVLLSLYNRRFPGGPRAPRLSMEEARQTLDGGTPVTVVDVRKRKAKTVDYKEIERYGIERKNSPLK